MSRDDLLTVNLGIIKTVAAGIKQHSPNAVVIVVSNPLDVMVLAMKQLTGFPKERVFGQAGVLDSSRFRFFVAQALGVSVRDVHAVVLGGHGDTMVPLPRYCSVGGVPLRKLMDDATIAKISKRTQDAGGEVVALLKTGSAFVSPAEASIEMAEAVLFDQKRGAARRGLPVRRVRPQGLLLRRARRDRQQGRGARPRARARQCGAGAPRHECCGREGARRRGEALSPP